MVDSLSLFERLSARVKVTAAEMAAYRQVAALHCADLCLVAV